MSASTPTFPQTPLEVPPTPPNSPVRKPCGDQEQKLQAVAGRAIPAKLPLELPEVEERPPRSPRSEEFERALDRLENRMQNSVTAWVESHYKETHQQRAKREFKLTEIPFFRTIAATGKDRGVQPQVYISTEVLESVLSLFINLFALDLSLLAQLDPAPFSHLRELRVLNLHGVHKLKDEELVEVFGSCPLLKVLNLSQTKVDGSFCAKAAVEGIEQLDLSDCSELQNQSVDAIYTYCASLCKLDLSGTAIGGEGALAPSSPLPPTLHHLLLNQCAGVSDAMLRKLVDPGQREGELQSLELMNCPGLTAGGILKALALHPNLNSLTIDQTEETAAPQFYAAVRERCPRLRRFVLEVPAERELFTPEELRKVTEVEGWIASRPPPDRVQVEELDLTQLVEGGCADTVLHKVLTAFPSLSQLSLAHCSSFTAEPFLKIQNKRITPALPQLQTLQLAHTLPGSEEVPASDILTTLLSYHQQLDTLGLSACHWVDDSLFSEIISTTPSLRTLDLSSLKLSERALLHLTDRPPLHCGTRLEWRDLKLSNCRGLSDSVLNRIAATSPTLESLYLDRCPLLSEQGLNGAIQQLHNLLSIDLSDLKSSTPLRREKQARISPTVTDQTVQTLGASCARLRSLHINGCHDVTDQGIETFMHELTAHEPHKSTLLVLSMIGLHRLTEKGINALTQGAPNLRSLNLYGCKRINNDALLSLTRLKKLQYLNVSMNPHLNDTNFHTLLKGLPSLTSLEASSCKGLSKKGLKVLLHPDIGHKLETLALAQYPAISEEEAATLVLNLPNLQQIVLGYEGSPKEREFLKATLVGLRPGLEVTITESKIKVLNADEEYKESN